MWGISNGKSCVNNWDSKGIGKATAVEFAKLGG